MQMFGHFLIFLLLNRNFYAVLSENQLKVKMKALYCEDINQSIYDGKISCSLKPTRDGTGYSTILYNFGLPAKDFWFSVRPFFKYGTIFRSWMLNVDADVCGAMENMDSVPTVGKYVFKAFQKTVPGLMHKCPYFHIEGARNISADKLINSMWPQMLPKGEYKLLLRAYTKSNQTFATVTVVLLLDSVDPLKSMQMGRK